MHRHIYRYVVTHRVQLAKFAFVGVVTFCINFSCFHVLYRFAALDYKVAVSLAYAFTVIAHFLLNRIFTFQVAEVAMVRHTWRYLAMLALNYALSLAVVWIAVEIVKTSPYFGVVASTAATAGVSFFVMKYFVFGERKMA